MDFGYIIKRAWAITWKHKILWLFGLFVMGGSSNFSSSSSSYSDTGAYPEGMSGDPSEIFGYAFDAVEPWVPVIIATAVLLLIIGIVWLVLSVAAQGGIVHLVNEAEEGREVKARKGWSVGFGNWGRVFLIYLLLFLPVIVLMVVFTIAIIVPMATAGSMTELWAGLAASFCCLMVVGIVAGIALSFLLTVMGTLAVRHAVLSDLGAIDALKEAWSDIRTRFKDVFLMWLINFGLGIAYSLVLGIAIIFVAIIVGITIVAGVWQLGVVLLFLLLLVMLLPQAIFATFVSAMWTIFFRRLTGLDRAAQAAPVYRTPAAPAPAYPPAPPGTPQAPPEAPQAPDGYPPPAPRADPPPAPPEAPRAPGGYPPPPQTPRQ